MKILICGIDGYLGWALAQYLGRKGHRIFGIDNLSRRAMVYEVGGDSLIPIQTLQQRQKAFKDEIGDIEVLEFSLLDFNMLRQVLFMWMPDVVVNLGQMPSAPYSMIDFDHAAFTHSNNVLGNLALLYAMHEICPEAHLVKLGTMGEYGTPNIPIAEGYFEVEYKNKRDRIMYPRLPGSFYHATKVHDSVNIDFANRIWGVTCTDIMQGVVYGTRIPDMDVNEAFRTRFDYDGVFGTAINRFVVQSIEGHPITLFGKGHQKRGFLPLKDSMQCISIIIDNPPESGTYRVINQIEEVYDLTELADNVVLVAKEFGFNPTVANIENPRVEKEDHEYDVDHSTLLDLGYEPTSDMLSELRTMFEDLISFKDRVKKSAIMPTVAWRK